MLLDDFLENLSLINTHRSGSGSVFKILNQIQQLAEFGSKTDPDPKPSDTMEQLFLPTLSRPPKQDYASSTLQTKARC